MEKWQDYRNEIDKQSQIGQDILSDSSDLAKYEEEINKINPSILSSITNEQVILQPGIASTDAEEKQISFEIVDAFKMLDLPANILNQDNVETIFYNCENRTIVDNEDSFKKDFFQKNSNYVLFNNSVKSISKEKDENIAKELETKFNNFKAKQEEEELQRVYLINTTGYRSKTSHYVFVVSVAVSAFLLLVVLALFIARLVTW